MNEYAYQEDIEKILISESEIKKIVKKLAAEITAAYEHSDKKLLLVCVLKGSLIFTADLMRELRLPLTIDFMQASSYGDSSTSCGKVTLKLDLATKNLADYDVLVIEDILDTGCTLSYLLEHLQSSGAHSVKLCTLLNKPDRRTHPVQIDFEGIKIPDAFVVGYGLDYRQKYRNLPFIGILKPEVYEKED